MLKTIYRYFILFIFISCLQFCSLTQIKDESPKINSVENGSKFKINLPEDHSSGYIWQLGENYDKSLLKDLGAVWHGNEKGIDFNLKALSVGQTTLSFVLRKYNDTANYKTFIVNIFNK
ncbi:MAG: protease inhibitor I42 family protein [Bacteroidetes bacterium]|nr:protease inhibitor I42 family protein [Bacteroidota bacterium]